MKPRPFDYIRPESAAEAVALLGEFGDGARVLAGGQSLMAILNLRLAEPDALIDVSRLPELDVIREIDGKIEVGAAVTQNKLLAWPKLAEKSPLLAKMLPHVGHFQTRNRGTVCGSVAHADPSSEIPLALATLGGEVVLRSNKGDRVLAAKDFQKDMLTTAREPDELILAVRFPVQPGKQAAFREVARRHGDFAIIAVAAVVEGQNKIRIGVGGMTGRPVVMLINSSDAASVKDAVAGLALKLVVLEDMHASVAMRRDMLRNLAPMVVSEALQCAA
jgi:2-furoyl-CoA dehydrogenase FAD binding subunit